MPDIWSAYSTCIVSITENTVHELVLQDFLQHTDATCTPTWGAGLRADRQRQIHKDKAAHTHTLTHLCCLRWLRLQLVLMLVLVLVLALMLVLMLMLILVLILVLVLDQAQQAHGQELVA